MATNHYFGFVCDDVDGEFSSVDFGDGTPPVVISKDALTEIYGQSNNRDEFYRKVQEAKNKSAEDWRRERGPDSELGRNMELGTPTTDHSSDPR